VQTNLQVCSGAGDFMKLSIVGAIAFLTLTQTVFAGSVPTEWPKNLVVSGRTEPGAKISAVVDFLTNSSFDPCYSEKSHTFTAVADASGKYEITLAFSKYTGGFCRWAVSNIGYVNPLYLKFETQEGPGYVELGINENGSNQYETGSMVTGYYWRVVSDGNGGYIVSREQSASPRVFHEGLSLAENHGVTLLKVDGSLQAIYNGHMPTESFGGYTVYYLNADTDHTTLDVTVSNKVRVQK
jgi:hypothetical protein